MPFLRLVGAAKAFWTTTCSAVLLAQKEALLSRLHSVTLPGIYGALGRKLASLDSLPPDLLESRETIRRLDSKLGSASHDRGDEPREGVSAGAKTWTANAVESVAKATKDAAASIDLQQAYVALGRQAAATHGEEVVPKDVARELANTQAQIAQLTEAISRLRSEGITLPTKVAVLASASYALSWMLPSMADPTGIVFAGHVIRHACRYTPAIALLLLIMNGVAITAAVSLVSSRRASKPTGHLLMASLIACTALNVFWMFVAGSRIEFLVGFYAWLICFPLFAYALWARYRQPATESRAGFIWARMSSAPMIIALACACYLLGSALPVAGSGIGSAQGWGQFRSYASGGGAWWSFVSKLTNFAVVGSAAAIVFNQRLSTLTLGMLFAGCCLGILLNVPYVLFEPDLRIGFFLWFASFCLLAVHTGREWASRRAAGGASGLGPVGISGFATAGLLVGLLVGLPMIRSAGKAILGSSGTASSVASSPSSVRSPTAEGRDDFWAEAGTAGTDDPSVPPDAGARAFLGVLMGLAAQQQAQQQAQQMQMQQQQGRAAFSNQMRDIQRQYSRMPGPPQGGFPYGGGQGGGGGYAPQRMQQYEGTCTRCGWRTGRQVNQGSTRCIQINGAGTPCSGVIVWTPVQGF